MKKVMAKDDDVVEIGIKCHLCLDGSQLFSCTENYLFLPYVISKRKIHNLNNKIAFDMRKNKELRRLKEQYNQYALENIYVPDDYPEVSQIKEQLRVKELSRLAVQRLLIKTVMVPRCFYDNYHDSIVYWQNFIKMYNQYLAENKDCSEILTVKKIKALVRDMTGGIHINYWMYCKCNKEFKKIVVDICQSFLNNGYLTEDVISDMHNFIAKKYPAKKNCRYYLKLLQQNIEKISYSKEILRLIITLLLNEKKFAADFSDFCNQRDAPNLRELEKMMHLGQLLFDSLAKSIYLHKTANTIEDKIFSTPTIVAEKLSTVSPKSEIAEIKKMYANIKNIISDSKTAEIYKKYMYECAKSQDNLEDCLRIYQEIIL